MGFPVPSLQNYNLYLYPTYPGGPTINASTGQINGNSSFTIPATDFTQAYGVNTGITKSPIPSTDYLTLNGNGTLKTLSIPSAPSFNSMLGLDLTSATGLLKGTSAPSSIPDVPKQYQDYLNFINTSQGSLSDLLTQPSFTFANLGVTVYTDGAGNVTGESIATTAQKLTNAPGITNPSFALPNTDQILQNMLIGPNPNPGAGDATLQNKPQPSSSQIAVDFTQLLNGVKGNKGIFQANNIPQLSPAQFTLSPSPAGKPGANNIFLQRLAALQPPEPGASITGANAEVGPQNAQQVAATQAGYNVETSNQYQQNIQQLTNFNIQQSGVYTSAQLADGNIPMAPTLPATLKSGTDLSQSAMAQQGIAMGANVEDAVSKKGSGGYVPFQMGNGASGGGEGMFTGGGFSGGFGGGGFQNPFGSAMGGGSFSGAGGNSANQQQGRPYRPLAYVA